MQKQSGLWLAILLLSGPQWASAASATVQFPLTPQSGAWLLCVKSYTGPSAQALAEELAEEIRQRYKLNAYVFNRGGEELDKEKERIQKIRQAQEDFAKQIGQPLIGMRKIKTTRIEEQFAVLIGGWGEMEAARKALDGIRKFPPPATKFMDAAVTASPAKVGAQGGPSRVETVYVNPFANGFVVPNPTIPKAAKDPNDNYDPLIFELNAAEPLSIFKCRKPWTLVVRIYQGGSVLQSAQPAPESGTFLSKIGLSPQKTENLLTASAMQAHSVAEFLRGMKPTSFDAYVMHTRNSSIVCVGSYDRPDDPALLQMQKTIGGLKIGHLDQLMAIPLPMEIPKKR